MDWPLTAALGSLAAVAGVVGFGVTAVMRTEPPKSTPSIVLASLQPGRQPAPVLSALVPPSVVVTAPARVFEQLPRPHQIALPPLSHEPPPKAAKPAVKHAVTHTPAPAPHSPPPRETHIKGVMTGGEIARIKAALRLTAEQLPLWRPVETVLRDIGKHQLVQIQNGGKPEVDSSAMTRVYWAAQSLLATLRPEQKEQVRRLAQSMGYGSMAAML